MASTADLVTDSVADLRENGQNEKGASKTFKEMTMRERVRYIKEVITIEPLLCSYVVAAIMCGPAVTTLQFDMACRVNKGFNDTVCDAVITGKHAELNFTMQNSEVQQCLSDMQSWCVPVNNVVPVLLLLFAGTYSDEHKIRKPFLLIPIFGEFFSAVGCILCVIFRRDVPVEVEGFVQTILPSFFGGQSMVVMAAFSYIADISTPEMRIIRLAAIPVCINICNIIAYALSGIVFNAVGYIPSLLIGLALFLIAFFYGVFMVKEPKKATEGGSLKTLLKNILNPKHAIDTLKLLVKIKGSHRFDIIFILVILFIFVIVFSGESNVFFLFTQHVYGWEFATDFTIYQSVSTIVNSLGFAFGIPLLLKVFALHDLIIIVISFLDKIVASIVYITVNTPFGLYIGLLAGCLQGISTAGIRSESTKCILEEDTGKMQSLMSIVEAGAGVLAAEIYHQGIYIHTRDTYPQAFFFFGILMFGLASAMLIWKYIKHKSKPPVEEATIENGTELKKQAEQTDITAM